MAGFSHEKDLNPTTNSFSLEKLFCQNDVRKEMQKKKHEEIEYTASYSM